MKKPADSLPCTPIKQSDLKRKLTTANGNTPAQLKGSAAAPLTSTPNAAGKNGNKKPSATIAPVVSAAAADDSGTGNENGEPAAKKSKSSTPQKRFRRVKEEEIDVRAELRDNSHDGSFDKWGKQVCSAVLRHFVLLVLNFQFVLLTNE